VLLIAGWALSFAPAHAQAPGSVLVASFSGPVTPVLKSYVDRTIGEAESSGAAAVVLELDTPGGSIDITEQIVQRMAQAKVPVIVYVWPSGAHASSAGTFITLAAHIAAMAPGSTIGAASPVGNEGEDLGTTEQAKTTNTMVADITNLAKRRGAKAVAWAQKAVAQAAAATADDALQMGVIDVVADNLPDLLKQLDGRQVDVAGQTVTLQLSDRPLVSVPLTPIESLLNVITDPTIAAILLTLGSSGLLLELANPGSYVPGAAGAVCLLLAFYALGVLQANLVGLAFVGLAFALFLIDLKATTHGVLTVAGIASFLLGGFILFNTPGTQVPWVTLITLALLAAGFFAFAVAKVVAARRRPPFTGLDSLIGQTAEVRKALEPEGIVFLEGELWSACAEDDPIPAGARVQVVGREGFRLRVRPAV
jgi:membrane-bound serine protease (ClpP class)